MCVIAERATIRTNVAGRGREGVMIKSTPNGSQSASKQRRKGNGGLVFLLLIVLVASAALAVVAFLAPARLAMPHEQVLGLVHGGIVDVEELTNVECASPEQSGGVPQAITRTSRTVMFGDNTSLVTMFSSAPADTALTCQ